MRKIKDTKGITLVALVITIIILLILAGVTINLSLGEDGIFSTAKKAAILTKIKEIEEKANIHYIGRKANEYAGGEEATFVGVISDLKKEGYEIEEKTEGTKTVKEIILSDIEISMKFNEENEITYTILRENKNASYYVKISGKYYEIKEDNGKIKVSEEATKIEETDNKEEITAESNNKSIVEAEIIDEKIKVTTKEEKGEAEILIKEAKSGKTATCKIVVDNKVESITLQKTAEVEKGKTIELTAQIEPSNTTDEITWSSSDTSKVQVTQNASNKNKATITGKAIGNARITIKVGDKTDYCDVTVTFTTVANAPDISGFNKSKTYYVAWDLGSSPYKINESTNINGTAPNNWYDYTQGVNQWANVKTTGGGNDCYWVWIPRYAYKVPTRSSTAQTIEIKFLQGKSNIPIGETTPITNTTPTVGSWIVHPAFTNAGNGGFGELDGIWVAKFEASSNSSEVVENPTASQLATNGGGNTTSLQVRVKPNVTSWREINVNNMFTVCQNLTKTVENKENSLVGATKIDAHMMKNTEWGAVAYLSRSVYGKNEEVWNNPYYNNTTNYSPITGLAGASKDASQTNLTNTYKYNEVGGGNASTTGNVYGVYDMAGGAWEYVAGILNSNRVNSPYYDFSGIDTKYYDGYDSYSNLKYGDAVYETSSYSEDPSGSWDSSNSRFPNSIDTVFRRGGPCHDGSAASVFAFNHYSGEAFSTNGFRPVVLSTQP